MLVQQGMEERQYVALTTRDVSPGGAFLLTPKAPPLHARGTMELVLHSSALRSVTGEARLGVKINVRVTRISPEGFAVAFDHSSDSIELAA